MALYHFSGQNISSSKGQSDVASIAYRSREKLYNERSRQMKFYKRETKPITFILKPCLPFYYRKLARNITDVSLLKQLLAEIDWLELNKVKVVLDRGFYSRENINAYFKHHQKFLIVVSTRLKMACEGVLLLLKIACQPGAIFTSIRDLRYCSPPLNGTMKKNGAIKEIR